MNFRPLLTSLLAMGLTLSLHADVLFTETSHALKDILKNAQHQKVYVFYFHNTEDYYSPRWENDRLNQLANNNPEAFFVIHVMDVVDQYDRHLVRYYGGEVTAIKLDKTAEFQYFGEIQWDKVYAYNLLKNFGHEIRQIK